MGDLIYLALVVAFFVLAAGFVHACERIIGPDVTAVGRTADPSPPSEIDRSEVLA